MHKRHSVNFRLIAEQFLVYFSSDGPEFHAEMKFDMDPDEPDYIEKDGETVENRANRMKSMNREEFKQHIGGVFEKHLNWRARHAKVSTTIGNLLPQYEQLLQEITDDVFNNPEYQRGIANYHTVYQDAWDMYLDAVEDRGNVRDPMYNHISKLPKAPGAYSNGQLLSIPEMYKGRRRAARTEYAKRWLRAKVGVEADPARAYARKKAEDMRGGYGRIWRQNIWKRLLKENQAVPTDEEVEAELEKLIQNRLGKNLTEAYLRPDLPPPPRTPEKEVRRRGRSMEGNIDTRDRTKAGRMMNEEYGTSARSEKEMNKQYTFTERTRGNPDAGFPKIVEFFKQGKKVRNEYVVQPERGALVIDSDPENPAESVIRLIDYRKADAMLANLSDPMNVYYAPLKAKGGIYSPEMKNEVFARSPVKGRESDYYTTDNMMILYTRIYPKLEEITSVLQGLSLGPSDFANLKSWDKANGAKIAPNITSDNFDLWQNVILTYCKNYDIPDAKTSADRGRAIFRKLGIIGGIPAPDPKSTPPKSTPPKSPPKSTPPKPDPAPKAYPDGVSNAVGKLITDKTPHKITILTPKEAEFLVSKNKDTEHLYLNGLTTLDKDTAEKLAAFGGEALDLSGLTTLDKDTAEKLAAFKGYALDLSGLTTLDKDTAQQLAAFKGRYINLEGLKTLDKDTAEKLAAFGGEALYLIGLTTIDKDTAQKLAAFGGKTFNLGGLTTIDKDTAQQLAAFKGRYINLEGLKTLDKDTAEKLAAFGGRFDLNGLTTLDKDTAQKLAAFGGEALYLIGLTTIDKDTAQQLAAFKGRYINLGGLTTIDKDTAQQLATFGGDTLYLYGLTTLDKDTAQQLATFGGDNLDLDLPDDIPAGVIDALGKFAYLVDKNGLL